jgi:hypothetical protein
VQRDKKGESDLCYEEVSRENSGKAQDGSFTAMLLLLVVLVSVPLLSVSLSLKGRQSRRAFDRFLTKNKHREQCGRCLLIPKNCLAPTRSENQQCNSLNSSKLMPTSLSVVVLNSSELKDFEAY